VKYIILLTLASILVSCSNPGNNKSEIVTAGENTTVVKKTTPPVFQYGIPVDSFDMVAGHIKQNVFLSDILIKHGVSMQAIDQVTRNSRAVFDVRNIRSGNNYILFCDKDSIARARYLVYEHDI